MATDSLKTQMSGIELVLPEYSGLGTPKNNTKRINWSVWISDQFSVKFAPNTPIDPNDIPDT